MKNNKEEIEKFAPRSHNKSSGVLGVRKAILPTGQIRYRPFIQKNKKRFHLGSFDNLEDAIKARKEAENKTFEELANQKNTIFTKEDLNEKLKNMVNELGRVPNAKEFKHPKPIARLFGSYKEFLIENGFQAPNNGNNIKYTKQVLIEFLDTLYETEVKQYGKMSINEYKYNRKPNWPSYDVLQKVTDTKSYDRVFIFKAGAEKRVPLKKQNVRAKSGPRFSKEYLLALARERAIELGRSPYKKEVEHSSSVRQYFDTWNDFLTAAGLDPTSTNVHKK